MEQLTRRNALLGALSTGAAALAGCVSNGGDKENTADNNDSSDEMTELDSSVERVGSDCAGTSHDEARVFLADDTYVVQGTIISPTPCYEPVIDSQRFEDGTLSLTVDVTAEDDDICVECVGEILYDATVSGPDPSEVTRVSVTHVDGETHETPAEDIPEGVPELMGVEITDSESRPRDSEQSGSVEVGEIDDSAETGTLTITGAIPTENPHYEPVITEAGVRGGTLSVTVDVESTLEGDRMGTMPLGVVEYTASAEIEQPAAIDSVQVSHPNSSYGAAWASDSASGSAGETGSNSESSSSDGSR